MNSGLLDFWLTPSCDCPESFCPDCGAPIYSSPPQGTPGFFGIRVGSIEQKDQLAPNKQIWCRSALKWVQDLSELPKFETQ